MSRRVRRVECQDVGTHGVGGQRRRLGRPTVREDAAFRIGIDSNSIALIAAEDEDAISLFVIEESDVPCRGIRIAAPEHDDASALRLASEIIAEALIAAGTEASRAAVAGEAKAGADERCAPRRFVIPDLRMARDPEHLQDLRIVHRTVNLGDAPEMRGNGKPRYWHDPLPMIVERSRPTPCARACAYSRSCFASVDFAAHSARHARASKSSGRIGA